MNKLLPAIAIFLVGCLVFAAPVAAVTFTDWTSVNTSTEIALGTLGPASVTLTGGNLIFGVTDGSSTRFDQVFFSPPLPTSDVVGPLGPNPTATLSYAVTFSSPVTNPRMHLESLASVLTFAGGITLTKLSGEADFIVLGSTVTGALDDHAPPGQDSNGTIQLNGTFTSFSFTAQATGTFSGGGDGFDLQIGADVAAVPGPATLVLLTAGLTAMGHLAARRRRA